MQNFWEILVKNVFYNSKIFMLDEQGRCHGFIIKDNSPERIKRCQTLYDGLRIESLVISGLVNSLQILM